VLVAEHDRDDLVVTRDDPPETVPHVDHITERDGRGVEPALVPLPRVAPEHRVPEVSAVRDADRIIGLVEAEERGPARLVINRVKPEMVRREDMISPDDIIDLLAIELIGIIPEDEAVTLSTNRGVPISLDGKSQAGQAFRNISLRLRGEEVPFLDIQEQGNIFGRLTRFIRSGGD